MPKPADFFAPAVLGKMLEDRTRPRGKAIDKMRKRDGGYHTVWYCVEPLHPLAR